MRKLWMKFCDDIDFACYVVNNNIEQAILRY